MNYKDVLIKYGNKIYLKFNNYPLNFKLIYGNIVPSHWYNNAENIEVMARHTDDFVSDMVLDQINTNNNVLFSNTKYKSDVLDPMGEYEEFSLNNNVFFILYNSRKYSLTIEPESIRFDGHHPKVPFELPLTNNTSVYDFIRLCYLSGINLEFSNAAIKILES